MEPNLTYDQRRVLAQQNIDNMGLLRGAIQNAYDPTKTPEQSPVILNALGGMAEGFSPFPGGGLSHENVIQRPYNAMVDLLYNNPVGRAVDEGAKKVGMAVSGASPEDFKKFDEEQEAIRAAQTQRATQPTQDATANSQDFLNEFGSLIQGSGDNLADALNPQAQAVDARGSAGVPSSAQVQASGSYGISGMPLPGENTKPDYSRVRDIIEQLRPQQVDTQALDDQKGMAILAGIAAGLAGDSSGGVGELLLRAGMGSMLGVATIDQAKLDAEEKFKESMNNYLGHSLKLEMAQAETDAEYAQRVYEANAKNALLAYERGQARANANKPELRQVGDKLVQVSRDANGNYVATPITTAGDVGRHVQGVRILMGTGMDEKRAEAAMTQALTSGDPRRSLPIMALSSLQSRGQTEQLLEKLGTMGEPGKNLVDRYRNFGIAGSGMAVKDDKAYTAEVEAARQELLMQTLMNSPEAMLTAMELSGMPQEIIQPYKNSLTAPRGK